MKRLFSALPIRFKLIAMIMTVTLIVTVLSSIGYAIGDYYQTREELRRDLLTEADLVLRNSQAAIEDTDRQTAGQLLRTLVVLSDLRAACLYDEDDRLFADALAPAAATCASDAPPAGVRLAANRIEVSQAGLIDGVKFGSITVRSDLRALSQRIESRVTAGALLLVVAMGVAVLLSSRLQSLVSDPISALAETARQVSARADYSLRATRTTEDELGLLVDSFNRMLARIQERETELSAANAELVREVAERGRAEQQRAELLVREREANRLKDEFLATLSHELRTPLNAILGWITLLRSNAVAPGAVAGALEKIERNAQVQARLIEDLLEVSRIVSGTLRLDYRAFDLAALSEAAIDSIHPTAQARGVTIQRAIAPGPLMTAGDPDRLQQVIWNLLSNAVKFTPAGGTVTLTLRRDAGVDELTVTDTGIGIEPTFLPIVFETFRQADPSTTRTHGGLGLGLSIARQLVELHGGSVTAASAGTNKGATFVVRLPVRIAERPLPGDTAIDSPELPDRTASRDSPGTA